MKENRSLIEERFVASARGVAKAYTIVGGETSFAVGGYGEHHVGVEKGVESFVPYADSPWQVGEEVVGVVAPPESEVAGGESEGNVAPHVVDALDVDEVGYGEGFAWRNQVGNREVGGDIAVGTDVAEAFAEPSEVVHAFGVYGEVMMSGEVFPHCGVGAVPVAADVPFAVPAGDESVGYVWDMPYESYLLGDFHSDDVDGFMSLEWRGYKWRSGGVGELVSEGVWSGGVGAWRGYNSPTRNSPTYNSSTYNSPTHPLPLCGDEFSPCLRWDYDGLRVSPAKKKREGHLCADRGGRESFGERQHHCRVPAGFRCQFNRMVGNNARFGVSRLPRGRNLVGLGRISEVRSANGNLCRSENLLILRAADTLEMLNRRASASIVHASPVEIARFAAQIYLTLGADMDFVVFTKQTGLWIYRPFEFWVNAKPPVKEDVASVHAKTLQRFKESAYDSKISVELPGSDVFVLHGKQETHGGVVCFLVDDQWTEKVHRLILWIPADHQPIFKRLFQGRCQCFQRHFLSFPLFIPLVWVAAYPESLDPSDCRTSKTHPWERRILYQICMFIRKIV